MLKRKAIRKIVITTFSIITIFIICIMPSKIDGNDILLNPSIETTYVNNSDTNDIYLLGKNNYLVKSTVLINSKNMEDRILQIIKYLTVNGCSKIPNGLSAIIPSSAKLNDIKIDEKIVILDFNDLLFDIDEKLEERLIEAITYSLISIDGIEGVKIKINGTDISRLPNSKKNIPPILNRNFGINKVFEFENINNITKVVLYYITNIDNKNYYVPVTKYLNDEREKINIIIENLSSNYIYESNLISMLSPNTELISYEMENNTMKLNFNQGIFTNNKLLEEVTYPISQSVFENYDINKILFQIDGKEIEEIEK